MREGGGGGLGWLLVGVGSVLLWQQLRKKQAASALPGILPAAAPAQAAPPVSGIPEGPPPAQSSGPVSVSGLGAYRDHVFDEVPESFDDSGPTLDDIAQSDPVHPRPGYGHA